MHPHTQALSAQQTASLAGSRPPPLWAMLAMVFLGWNEFLSLLYNPVCVCVSNTNCVILCV